MRILLTQPPHRDTFGYSMPPVGLLHAAAGARARGHEVAWLDLPLLLRRGELPARTPSEADALASKCAKRLLALEPDALGLGAMLSSVPAALELAAELRARRPDLPLILGGQGPESVEEAVVARHSAVDAVAVGEADHTLADWLDALEAEDAAARAARRPGSDAPRDAVAIPGLVLRHGGRPLRTAPRPLLRAADGSLDAVPPPAWDLADSPAAYAAAAGQDAAMFPIDLGRGCTFACTFCTTPVFWGRTARHLSPARAVDELDRLAALGVGTAYVTHDLFTFDRASVLAICAEKLRRGNRLRWECRTRLDLVDEELLAAMAAAGCVRILFGVESDRPEVLRRVNKAGRAESLDVRAALRMVESAGIAAILGTMAGVPGETAADLDANLRLMAECATGRGVSLSLHWFNVTPGNGRAAEAGAALRHEPGLFADLVRGHDVPAGHVPTAQRELIAADPEIFAGFRVFAAAHASTRELFLLTRHAHVILEALPRSYRALAAETGRPLARLLVEAVEHGLCGAAPEERDEPLVLTRVAAVRAAGRFARRSGSVAVATLARYEETLHAVVEPRVDRFAHDPRALVAAIEAGAWPPARAEGPVETLLVRRGDVVRAFAVAPFVADVAAGLEDRALARRWPELDPDGLATRRAQARAAVERLTGAAAATDCRAAED
ncbi:MAG TPA: radical SAM protein [Planctomycetota bacterium]|nr:radical SAM protein [Planctomycetota bacterium]